MAEDRRQRTDDRGQKTDDGRQKYKPHLFEMMVKCKNLGNAKFVYYNISEEI